MNKLMFHIRHWPFMHFAAKQGVLDGHILSNANFTAYQSIGEWCSEVHFAITQENTSQEFLQTIDLCQANQYNSEQILTIRKCLLQKGIEQNFHLEILFCLENCQVVFKKNMTF